MSASRTPSRSPRRDALGARAFAAAREVYASHGVDVEAAFRALDGVSLSVHCWQGDDVTGFETRPGAGGLAGSGLQATGSFPGRARTIDELRADLDLAFRLIPGRHRLNLHAIYGDFRGRAIDRDAVEPAHFRSWVQWARERGLGGLDFNATCFGHPRAASGFTLSHPDRAVRAFWIEHVRRCRRIAAGFGRAFGTPSVHDLWIPDGAKEVPLDRWSPRARLEASLDEIYAEAWPAARLLDALESKLFGIGSESYVVGSHEFYLGYALTRGKTLCLDLGHFHPTESVADKLSAVLRFSDGLLVHVSRGVRWDSDHVVLHDDALADLAREIVRGRALGRVRLALDYFDASVNRVGAWVVGARATLRAVLAALLEPAGRLRDVERRGSGLDRLAAFEDLRALPVGPVWDAWCERRGVPPGSRWTADVAAYEARVQGRRG